jgi:hypothetical protein
MALEAFLTRVSVSLLSNSLKWLTKKALPNFSALWARMHPFSVDDIVSLRNGGNFSVRERRGTAFRYEYRLVDISGINPWLLPALSSNPRLIRDAAMFWYRVSKGCCYLKKIGHPKLELKASHVLRNISNVLI